MATIPFPGPKYIDAKNSPDLNRGGAYYATTTLMNVMVLRVPRTANWGTYNPKPVLGIKGNPPSNHGTGRALDLAVPNARTSSPAIGNWVFDFLIAHANLLGVMEIIWNNTYSSSGRGVAASYGNKTGGSDTAAHRDHVHFTLHPNWACCTDPDLGLTYSSIITEWINSGHPFPA